MSFLLFVVVTLFGVQVFSGCLLYSSVNFRRAEVMHILFTVSRVSKTIGAQCVFLK